MASITIRNLDEKTRERLRIRAARRHRSMEDETRNILREALARDSATPGNLARAIATRFKPLGGVELALPRPTANARAARGSIGDFGPSELYILDKLNTMAVR